MSICRSVFVSVVLAALIGAAGCVTAGGGEPGEKESWELVIIIENEGWRRATVYTTPEFGNRRLGFVAGNSTATFKLDWDLPRIKVYAEMQDGRTIGWRSVIVKPGEIWTFTILARQ